MNSLTVVGRTAVQERHDIIKVMVSDCKHLTQSGEGSLSVYNAQTAMRE